MCVCGFGQVEMEDFDPDEEPKEAKEEEEEEGDLVRKKYFHSTDMHIGKSIVCIDAAVLCSVLYDCVRLHTVCSS